MTTTEIRSPYSGDLVGIVAQADEAELAEVGARAAEAFERWRTAPSWRRAEVLGKIAQGLRDTRGDLARTITADVAKPIKDARVEVDRAAQTFTIASEEAKRIGGELVPLDLMPGSEGRIGLVRRFPAGPVLGITPFNFPLNLVAHKVAPAIAAGCSVVIKPAPQAPHTALRLLALAREAGLDEHVLQVVPTPNELAHRLIEDPRFAVLSFTGSPGVGWALKAQAGRKRVLLELGGNAAVIVHKDANLDAALTRALVGGYAYSGQVCISVQRVYVERSLFVPFIERFVEGVRSLVVGDPADESTQVSALVRPSESDRIGAWVDEAKTAGARVLAGGHTLDMPGGRAFAPTVLTNARDDLRVVQDEVFGPVVVVEPYDDIEHAFDAVNRGRFGLQAGVFTNDLGVARRAFERLEVGAVLVNEVPTWRADHMPYGGVKESGLGREGVRYAIEEMTERRIMVWPAP